MKIDTEVRSKELETLLRRDTNGAVAASMQEKGLVYGLNYGVSIADIRKTCALFAPDHALAKHIYPQDVRELRLAAYFIAVPELVTPEEFPFWAQGITTTEMGSNGALSFFSKSTYVPLLIFDWLKSGTPYLLMFTAVMSAAANLIHREGRIEWDWRKLLEVIQQRVEEHTDTETKPFLREGIAALLLRLLALTDLDRKTASDYISRLNAANPKLGDYLEREVGWALV